MKTIVKLSILWMFLAASFESWKTEVWSRDLDERYCCDGSFCSCGGATVLEVFGPESDYETE
jgi:hypothetical protein